MIHSFFDFYCDLFFALILSYFAFILPFSSPFLFFFPLSSCFFYIFPFFSSTFHIFPPDDTGWYLCQTEEFGPSRTLQLTCVKCRESENVHVYSCCAVFYVVGIVMCIYVIYKFLRWDNDQQLDRGEPSWKWPNQALRMGSIPSIRVTWWIGRLSLLWDMCKDGLIRCSADNA